MRVWRRTFYGKYGCPGVEQHSTALQRTHAICLTMFRRVQLIDLIYVPNRRSTIIQENILAIMGISRTQIRQKCGLWCKWERPSPGWFKLNIDGSALHGITIGGGILRDHGGKLIGGSSHYYGEGTNKKAVFVALRDGLFFCLALNISPVLIDSDSAIVVNAVRTGIIGNWRIEYPFRECMKLFSSSFEIIHGFRQKNHVADRLAAGAHLLVVLSWRLV